MTGVRSFGERHSVCAARSFGPTLVARCRESRGDLQHSSESNGFDEIRIGAGGERPRPICFAAMLGDDENFDASSQASRRAAAHQTSIRSDAR